jgi:hypothetical protein
MSIDVYRKHSFRYLDDAKQSGLVAELDLRKPASVEEVSNPPLRNEEA